MLRKKSRRSSRGNGPVTLAKRAATLAAREKLQRAIAPWQRAIAPPSTPPSQRAIARSPPLQQALAPFASLPAPLFSIPSFASSAGADPERLIEESSALSACLEAHAAAHKAFATVLRSKVVMDVEERTACLPCSKPIDVEQAASLPIMTTQPAEQRKVTFPRESIKTAAERDELCQDALCRPFFAVSIYNFFFFFEEPN
jgi:hypothetical protein